jgi:hypothetical protein
MSDRSGAERSAEAVEASVEINVRRIGAITVNGEMPAFREIAEKFPYVSRSVLSQVGMKAARQFYSGELKDILHPRSFSGSGAPLAASGKREVSFSVSRDNKSLVIRSYPMNIYRSRGPIKAKRTEGAAIFRSFEGGLDVAGMAGVALENVLRDSELFKPKPNTEWNTRLQGNKGAL